jgi:Uma2 family endonuclease
MGEPLRARPDPASLWRELEQLPEHLKGEIIDGELHVQPRPRFRHSRANAFLARHLGGSFDYDSDGPGGWWILVEPGIELPDAPEVAPDLAGWRRERMPAPPPEGEPIRLIPDWVCEVLSRSNAGYDRSKKFPFYARIGVAWLWVVDPREQTVEIRRLHEQRWLVLATFSGPEPMRTEPYESIEIPLARLWIDR